MKKIIALVIIILICKILLLLNLFEVPEDSNDKNNKIEKIMLKEGIYTGTGQGFVGKITVQIEVSKENTGDIIIKNINVLETDDIRIYFEKAKEEIFDRVLKLQRTDIEAVTGATESSMGLLEAIENARKRAYKRP